MNSPPSNLLSWLTCQDSLTNKLKAIATDVRLEILQQKWVLPSLWHQQALGITEHSVLHRDILTWGNQRVCWYARTIIPLSSYQGEVSFFNRLQQESLGDLIYGNAAVKRVALIHYAIDKEAPEYGWLNEFIPEDADSLWARRSLFKVNSLPFYLVELFLPGLLRCFVEVESVPALNACS